MTAAPRPLVLVGNEPHFRTAADGSGRRSRLVAVQATIEARRVPGVGWRVARPATREDLERAHDGAYLDRLHELRGLAPAAHAVRSVLPGSMAAVLLAAGACAEGVDLLLDGAARAVFVVAEPPGHHAERGRGMGFCAVNNVAVAARYALARGVRRVLVVDWDVHHGNGTQEILGDRCDVLFFDAHQAGIFPGTGLASEIGRGDGTGHVFNVPLPAGMGDADYATVFEELLVPLAERFAPELVIVSAGFDAHADDPLGGMEVTAEGFGRLCAIVDGIARRHAGGRLLLALEGGYDAASVGESAACCAEVLVGRRAARIDRAPSAACREAVEALSSRVAAFPRSAAPRLPSRLPTRAPALRDSG